MEGDATTGVGSFRGRPRRGETVVGGSPSENAALSRSTDTTSSLSPIFRRKVFGPRSVTW